MKYIILIMTISCFIYAEEIDVEYRYKESKLKFKKLKFQTFNEQRYIYLEDFLNLLEKTEEVNIINKKDEIIIKRDYEKIIIDLGKGKIKKLGDKNNTIWKNILEKKDHDNYINIFLISEIFYEYGMNFYYKNGEYKMINSIDLMKDVTDGKTIPNLDNENQISPSKKKESILYFFKLLKNNYDTGKSEEIDKIISFLKKQYFDKLANTKDNEDYYDVFKKMINEFDNAHIEMIPDNVWSPNVNRNRFRNGSKLVYKDGKLLYKSLLKYPMEIISINNIPLKSKSKKDINELLRNIFMGYPNNNLDIKVFDRSNKIKTKHLKIKTDYKEYPYYSEKPIFKILNNNVAYLYIPSFKGKEFQEY